MTTDSDRVSRYVATHPAVVAVVDHFVNVGFDPSYADYDEVAQTVLEGLAKAGYELLSPVAAYTAKPCVAPGCDYAAARGSGYCTRHGVAWDRGGAYCDWCGKALTVQDGRWIAVKGAERGYDPIACDANTSDGTHEPSESAP